MDETTTEPKNQETVARYLERSAPVIANLNPELRAQVERCIDAGGSVGFTMLADVGPIFERLILLATAQRVPPETVLEDVRKTLAPA